MERSRVAAVPFTALDHVQLAMPDGEEEKARHFYCEILGMQEIPKPPALTLRGGCWFKSGDVQIHLGVESDFHPARKAHPALRCADYDVLIAKLSAAQILVKESNDIPGLRRCHLHDSFGNRLELIAA